MSSTHDPSADGPLRGRTIVVTRARAQAADFVEMLRAAGASVVLCPTIEIAPPDSWESLDWVIHNLGNYQWIIFTSTNGVDSFFARLADRGKDARALGGAKVAAVGAITAEALRRHGIVPDLVPEKFLAAALLPSLGEDQRGVRTAIVRAAKGRTEISDVLRKRGGTVDLGIAYQTREARAEIDAVRRMLADGSLDALTFTSGSTAANFFALLTPEEREAASALCIASIGPSTSEAIRALAVPVTIEASESSSAGLRDALVSWFQ
ncbi:MAG: uroporphyrinogen-III synthase [Thermoanaerobaculia bacterium]